MAYVPPVNGYVPPVNPDDFYAFSFDVGKMIPKARELLAS